MFKNCTNENNSRTSIFNTKMNCGKKETITPSVVDPCANNHTVYYLPQSCLSNEALTNKPSTSFKKCGC